MLAFISIRRSTGTGIRSDISFGVSLSISISIVSIRISHSVIMMSRG